MHRLLISSGRRRAGRSAQDGNILMDVMGKINCCPPQSM